MKNVSHGWCRINLPYCFVKLNRPGHVWLPLNRNYAPLGHAYMTGVDNENYLAQAIQFAAEPMTFKDVWWTDANGESHAPYLYNDGDESRTDYFERYERLLSRSVKVPLRKHPNSHQCYLPPDA